MSAQTSIQWTQRPGTVGRTWNCLQGCSDASEGCRFCYARKAVWRMSHHPNAKVKERFSGLVRDTKHGPVWTGHVKMIPEALFEPFRWKQPSTVFVNSMSDLFHERVTDNQLDIIFAIMARAWKHTFIGLTKRPERARAYLSRDIDWAETLSRGGFMAALSEEDCCAIANSVNGVLGEGLNVGWPLKNFWLGTSIEDQKMADKRTPSILQTPAAVRFLSVEPLLEPLDLGTWFFSAMTDAGKCACDWVIVGGESGPHARPHDLAWDRSLLAQCRAAGVAYFEKQWGAVPMMRESEWRSLQFPTPLLNPRNHQRVPDGFVPLRLKDSHGGDWDEWPSAFADLRVREFPA